MNKATLFLTTALIIAASSCSGSGSSTSSSTTKKPDQAPSPLEAFIEYRNQSHAELGYSLDAVLDSLAQTHEYHFDIEDEDGIRIMIIYTFFPERNAIMRYEHYYGSTSHAVEHFIGLGFDKFFYYSEAKSGPGYHTGQFEVYDFDERQGTFSFDAVSSALFKLEVKDLFKDETPERILEDASYRVYFEMTDASGGVAEYRLQSDNETYHFTQWLKGNVISFNFRDGTLVRSVPCFDNEWALKDLASAAPEDLLPYGYEIIQKETGDLNGDGVADVAFIVRDADNEHIASGIMIFFDIRDRGWQLVLDNRTCLTFLNEESVQMGSDGTPSITISRGALRISFTRGSSFGAAFTFRFQNNAFELIGYDHQIRHDGSISINFSSRRMLRQHYSDMWNVASETWHDIKVEKPAKLSEIDDLEQFNINSIYIINDNE